MAPAQVLVLESDAVALGMIQRALRTVGFAVDAASNRIAARDYLSAERDQYHVALVAARLGSDDELSGPGFVREIRGHSPRCVVVLMLSLGESALCDGQAFVRRPVDPALLPAQIVAAAAEHAGIAIGDPAATMRQTVATLRDAAKVRAGSRGVEVITAALLGMLTRQQIADLQGLDESTARETIHTVLARIGASELCDLFRVGLELAGVDFCALLSELIAREDVRQRMLDKLAEDREARETRRHGRGPGRRGR